jgi:hypothetical protein
VFDNYRLAKVVSKHRPDRAAVHCRQTGVLIETGDAPGIVAVKAKVDTLVGEITPTAITPPLVGGIKQHSRTENPTLELVRIETVGLDEHFGETRLGQVHVIFLNSGMLLLTCRMMPLLSNS